MTAAVPAPLRFPAGIAHTAVVMQKLRDWGIVDVSAVRDAIPEGG